MSPAIYLIDTSGLFRIFQLQWRNAWAEQLAAGVIVQQMLTEAGTHRSAGPADLLIAATAERGRLVMLCDDQDYRTVARVTGQPVKLVTDA